MSVTHTAYLLLGMQVSRADFFTTRGTTRKCCYGHEARTPEARYCASDGMMLETVPVLVATPEFTAFVKAHDDPAEPYPACQDFFAAWLSEELDLDGPGVHSLATSSEARRKDSSFLLGVQLARVRSDHFEKLSVDPAGLVDAAAVVAIRARAKELGIDPTRPIELFLVNYVSV